MDKLIWTGMVLVTLLTACTDPADWEPRGEVKLVQFRETTQDANKIATVTYSVTNTGKVDLNGVELALGLRTDKEQYRIQTRTTLALTPGKLGYSTATATYFSNKEIGTLGTVTVDSAAFH